MYFTRNWRRPYQPEEVRDRIVCLVLFREMREQPRIRKQENTKCKGHDFLTTVHKPDMRSDY